MIRELDSVKLKFNNPNDFKKKKKERNYNFLKIETIKSAKGHYILGKRKRKMRSKIQASS